MHTRAHALYRAVPQIEGLPTVVFIPKDQGKPALRTEGLLPADRIVQIFKESM